MTNSFGWQRSKRIWRVPENYNLLGGTQPLSVVLMVPRYHDFQLLARLRWLPHCANTMSTNDKQLGAVFLVRSTVVALQAMRRWTLFGLVERITAPSYRFVELWVIAFTFFNILSLIISVWVSVNWIVSALIICIGVARIIEILLTQMLLFIDFMPNRVQGFGLVIRSVRRTVLLAFLNYLEIVGWFASFYIQAFHYGVFAVNDHHPAWPLVYQSIIGMIGNTVGVVNAQGRIAWFLLSMQTMIGFFMITVVLSRTIGSIPSLHSMESDEKL